jgi:predicted Rossmann-fold nucleotide-binding protein
MRIAIIGSRTFNNYPMLCYKMREILLDLHVTKKDIEIVSGGAKGADSLGAKYAERNSIPLTIYTPDWKDLSHPDCRIKENSNGKYDANAGHRRNTKIINNADVVVAFHNGSPGTADSLRKAKKQGKKIFEVIFV